MLAAANRSIGAPFSICRVSMPVEPNTNTTFVLYAYSQNYVYLIKKPADQYQVILEVEDKGREKADNLSLLYIKSDDGSNLVPLRELVTWKQSLGPCPRPRG